MPINLFKNDADLYMSPSNAQSMLIINISKSTEIHHVYHVP